MTLKNRSLTIAAYPAACAVRAMEVAEPLDSARGNRTVTHGTAQECAQTPQRGLAVALVSNAREQR
jgi:hypothetical protein